MDRALEILLTMRAALFLSVCSSSDINNVIVDCWIVGSLLIYTYEPSTTAPYPLIVWSVLNSLKLQKIFKSFCNVVLAFQGMLGMLDFLDDTLPRTWSYTA